MLASASDSSTARPADFSHVLAKLAAKLDEKSGEHAGDTLADDVVTLSYEQALRRRGQFRSTATLNAGGAGKAKLPEGERVVASRRARGAGYREAARDDRRSAVQQDVETDQAAIRKASSITVRMSAGDCAQVHARAAEAGMTVSAFVRSCVFEAESLRAQVKRALAEMRAGADVEQARSERGSALGDPKQDSAHGWRSRLFRRWASKRRSRT